MWSNPADCSCGDAEVRYCRGNPDAHAGGDGRNPPLQPVVRVGSTVSGFGLGGGPVGYTALSMFLRRPTDPAERERLKQVRRDQLARRKAALAVDPRFQAAKQEQKARRRAASDAAKARRKELAKDRKQREA